MTLRLIFAAMLAFSLSNVMAQRTDAIPIVKYPLNNYSTIAKEVCENDTCAPLIGKPLVAGKPITLAYASLIGPKIGLDLTYVPGIIAPNFTGGGSPEIKGLVNKVAGMTDHYARALRKDDILYFRSGAKGVAVSKSGKIITSSGTTLPGASLDDKEAFFQGFFSFKATPKRLPVFSSTSDAVFDKFTEEIAYFAIDPENEKIMYGSFRDLDPESDSKVLARKNPDNGEWEILDWDIPGGLAEGVWGALAVDRNGSLYIADSTHHVIVKADFDDKGRAKSWQVIGGTFNKPGFKNHEDAGDALFNKPSGICVDREGNIYIGDAGNNVIRKIDTDGEVTTFAGSERGEAGLRDNDDPEDATFNFPTALAYNEKFKTLYVVDYNNKLIREIDRDRQVTTLAGTPVSYNPLEPEKFFKTVYFMAAKLNADPDEARFSNLTGIAIDPDGFGVYVSDGQYIKYVSTFQAVFALTSAIREADSYQLPLPVLPPGIFMNASNGSFYGVPLLEWPATTYTVSVLNSKGMSLLNGAITFEVVRCPVVKDTVLEKKTIVPKQLPFTWNGRTFHGAEDAYVTLKNITGCDSVVLMQLSVGPDFNYNSEPYLLSFGQQIKPIVPTTAGSKVETFSVSPALPDGLTLNAQTGEITGTPQAYTSSQPVPAIGPKTPVQYPAPWKLNELWGADITQVKISDGNQKTIFENNSAFKSLLGSAGKGTGTAGAYTDFSAVGTIKMFTNTPYSIRLSNALTDGRVYTLNQNSGMYNFMNSYAVYIDYNRDGDFEDAGERVYISEAPQRDAHAEVFNLAIPGSATPGVTKMRIYCVEASTKPTLYFFTSPTGQFTTVGRTTTQALSFYPFFNDISTSGERDLFAFSLNYGEFEDYNLEIQMPATQSFVVTGSNSVASTQATVNLAIAKPTTSVSNLTICSTELPYTWNGLTFTQAGAQTAHLVNIYGADSAATVNLTVKQATSSVITVANCGPYTYQGNVYTESGDYTVHVTNAAGCDSAIIFRFRQKATASTTNIEITPAQLPYTWNGLTFTTAGTQSARLTNREGCDSTATLVLHVGYNVYYPASNRLEVNKPIVAISPQVEGNYPFQVSLNGYDGYQISPALPNGLQLNSVTGVISGTPTQLSPLLTYTITLNQEGAKPTTFKLSVGVPSASTTTINNCGPYTWNGVVYDKATTVSATFKNQYGFDSTATLVLSVRNPSSTITHLFANPSELPIAWNGINLTREGEKTIYLVNAVGCDSAVTVNVVLNPKVAYNTPNILAPNKAIAPIAPQSTGGAIPSAIGHVSTLMKTSYLSPISIALDAQENSYVSDEQSGKIYKINRKGVVSAVDGFGTIQALLAIDKAGNLYVADRSSNRILRKDLAGLVTVLADANTPAGIAVDAAGTVYFSEGRYHRIRKISNTGSLSTLAGGTTAGYADGNGTAAKFNNPSGLSIDAGGNVYVADLLNNRIRKISPAGEVTTVAGNGAASSVDGITTNAGFNAPVAIAADNRGNQYVVDNGSHKIRKIDAAGSVSTLAGTIVGYQDGAGSQATFNAAMAITTDSHGQVYVADKANAAIRQINAVNYTIHPALVGGLHFDEATGVISGTPADKLLQPVTHTIYAFNKAGADSAKVVLAVCNPAASSFSIHTCDRYVWNDSTYTSSTTHTRTLKNRGGCDSVVTMHLVIRKSSTGATTTATACGSYEWKGTTYDKTGLYTKVYNNAVGCDSTVYLNLTIKPITTNNLFVDLAPSQLPYKWRDSMFTTPGTKSILLVNSVGCDSILSMTVRISALLPNISYALKDTTLYWEKKIDVPITMTNTGTAIPALKIGESDTLLRFSPLGANRYLLSVVKGPDGAYYATATNSNQIFRLSKSGVWSVFAGTGGGGLVDGPKASAELGSPRGLGFDSKGNLYVVTYMDARLRKITPDGLVSTINTSPRILGTDPNIAFAYMYAANALIVDADDNVFVQSQNAITKFNFSTNQFQTTAMNYSAHFGTGELDMKTDSKGNIYILPNIASNIVKIKPNGQMVRIGQTSSPYDVFKEGNGPDAFLPWVSRMAIDPSNDNVYLMAFGQLLRVDTSENVKAVTGRWFTQDDDRIISVDSGEVAIINNLNGKLYNVHAYGIGSIPFMDNYGVNGLNGGTRNFTDFDQRIRLDSTGAIVGTPRTRNLLTGYTYAFNTATSYSIIAANQHGISTAPMLITTKNISYRKESFLTASFPFVWRGRSFTAPTDTATYLTANKTLGDDTTYQLNLVYEGKPQPVVTAAGDCAGGPVTLTTRGAAKNAISFDGTNTGLIKNRELANSPVLPYIGVSQVQNADGSRATIGHVSFEVWIKPASVAGTQYLLTRDTVKTNGVFFGYSIQNGKFVYEFTKGNWPFTDYKLSSVSNVEPNVWTHVAASYVDSTMYIFVNGKLEGSQRTAGRSIRSFYEVQGEASVFPDFFLGGLGGKSGFRGEMDELRLWSTIRNADSIKATMNTVVNPFAPGLVLYYRFDDEVGANALDFSSSGRRASFLKPAASVSSAAPIDFTSYKWMPGGATTKSIVVNLATNTLYTATVTDYKGSSGSDTYQSKTGISNSIETVRVCASSYTWHGTVYTASTNTSTWRGTNQFGCDSIVTLHLTLDQPPMLVIAGPAKICAGGTATLSAAGFSNYVWLPNGETGAAITVQPTTTTTYTLKATDANGCQATASKTVVVSGASSFTEKISACGSYTWHGTTYTSSTANATWVGVNAAGCDSVVTLDLRIDPLPAPVIVSANGDATCLGNPLQLTARASGKQLLLDGASRVAADAMGVDPSTGFTLEGWVNFSSLGNMQSIISQTAGNKPLPFDAYLHANGTVGFAVGNEVGSSSITTTTALTAKKWYHLAFVYSNKSMAVYIDGVASASGTAVVPVAGKLHHFMIGNNESLSRPMVGAVDELRVWNAALTKAQIAANMNASVKPGSDGLVAYYKFDEEDNELPVNAVNGATTATIVGNARHSVSTAPLVYQSYNWTGGVTSPVITAADASSLYNLSITDVNGCSAVASGKAVVSSPTSFTEVVRACGPYAWHGVTYTSSNNTAKWTTQNAAGCDSAVTLNLTIVAPSASTVTATACNYFVWHGKTYTESTACATWVGVNAAGCDSVVTLNLTITRAIERTEMVVSCRPYRWHDSTYTVATTTPVWYGISKSGCDSIVRLNLTMAELPVVKINAASTADACPGSGVVLRNATKAFTKYATGVKSISSELTGNVSKQIIGAPDTYPNYGDLATAWSTKDDQVGREFIELTYDNDQPINFIEIYETFNSGTIDTVYVKNPGTNAFEVVYTGSAELYNQPLQNRITFPLTTFAVSTIRIAINSVDLPAQKSIDAVGIGIANSSTYKWSDGSTGDILLVNKSGQYVLTATNEDGCSVSDTINLVMQDPIKPVIVAGGETALCTGGSVTLQAPIGFATYKWSNGATTPSITINQGGSYSVTVTTENGCKSVASDAVTVTVKPALSAPTVVVTNNCGSATLRATGSGTFLWSNGATTASITVNNPGTYSVTQTVDGCTSIPASAIAAPKEAPAKPVITASGATTFYTGGSVTLLAPAGFASYKWSNGATTPSITVLQSGPYSVQVTNGSGCTSVASNPVVVTVNPPPSALYVSHLDGDNGQTANNNIRPYLQLHNEGPTTIPYKDVTIRYWLTVEEFAPMTNLFVDYAQLGTARVKMKYVKLGQPRQGAYGYIEYSFDASAGTLPPGKNSGPIQSRAAKSDWTLFNETNDYSYAPGKTYTRNNKITVYQNGVLVGGTEPAAIPVVQKLKASSQDKSGKTSTNAIQQWLQVTNEGNTPVNYKDLTVRYWFTADGNKALNYALDYTPLGNSAVNYRFQKLATPLSGADTYLELSFNVADSLYPASATGTIQQRFYKSDWSLFSQGNDHSYQANKILAENVRVTVYLKGQLVYGEEPSAFTTLHQSQNQPPATAIGDNGTTAGSLDLAVLGNPVTGQVLNFLVKGGENKQVQVTLADAQGRVLARKSLAQPSAASQQQISVNGMANGILFLSVTTPQEKKTLPVLINH